MSIIGRYIHWLHTRWPAGRVEPLPLLDQDNSTSVTGIYVIGDLAGVPLIKYAVDSGVRTIQKISAELGATKLGKGDAEILDVAIIGAGISGISAAVHGRKLGLTFALIDPFGPLSTVDSFSAGKPILLYPDEMVPQGDIQFSDRSLVKDGLLQELQEHIRQAEIQVIRARAEFVEKTGKDFKIVLKDSTSHDHINARRVVVAIGRTGAFRKLGVQGEDLQKVYHTLQDPLGLRGRKVAVVGGGDSALETALLLSKNGADVSLIHRQKDLGRPKAALKRKVQTLPELRDRVLLGTKIIKIEQETIGIQRADGTTAKIPNDAVFLMLGREPPTDFFKRSGISLQGEWNTKKWASMIAFLFFCTLLFHWKSNNQVLPLFQWFQNRNWFPFNFFTIFAMLGDRFRDFASTRTHIVYTLVQSASKPNFYYTLAYSMVVAVFGWKRIRRNNTPYVRLQTFCLIGTQLLPLFLLPEVFLPWAGNNGWFEHGTFGGRVADLFFETYDGIGYDRAYWRSYGLTLAWPLFVWNIFTDRPMFAWLVVGFLQTFVVIPILVYRFGKGAYCGWICSCGALAETLGDQHRRKMPHGPAWNRLNVLGQLLLLIVGAILSFRIAAWIWPGSQWEGLFNLFFTQMPIFHYSWFVDVFLSGVLGVGLYFWFSGRTWCRFACPLAALMHIYARFSRFRIFADKQKCISCNECTAVCHQGIDVMNFANKGAPMEDPQCVRCGSCVQICPTDVLTFGEIDLKTGKILRTDRLSARKQTFPVDAHQHR